MMKTLDPRIKLLSTIIITTLALLFLDPLWMLGLCATAFFLDVFLGASFKAFLKRIRKLTSLLFIIIAVQVVFVRTGEPVLFLNHFTLIYDDGLVRGVNTAMRYFVIICSAAMMAGENSRRVIASLTQMKIPYTFAFMIMITLRFIPVFSESFSDAMTSIQLRGIELKKVKLGKKVRLYGHLLLPVVADAIIKSQDLSTAMEARGFGANKKRTAYLVVRMRQLDYLFLTLLILLSAGALGTYYMFA